MKQLFRNNDDPWQIISEGHIDLLDDGRIQIIFDIPESMEALSDMHSSLLRIANIPWQNLKHFKRIT